jgi:putative transposase
VEPTTSVTVGPPNAVTAMWEDNYRVYGARKVWKAAQRCGHDVGRDQVARLMRELGIEGVSRLRKKVFTTRQDPDAPRAPDLVNRQFTADRPDALWVTDLTYVPTRSGMAYVCFIVDAFSRRIVGWRVAANMKTEMVLDALEMARASRGGRRLVGLVTHSDAGSQFTAVRFTERLEEIGARPSIGTVADSYDNALAETTNGLYKTECVYGPDTHGWDDVDELELATLSWVHWFNETRLHGHCQDIPTAEYDAAFYAAQHSTPPGSESNKQSLHQTQGGSHRARQRPDGVVFGRPSGVSCPTVSDGLPGPISSRRCSSGSRSSTIRADGTLRSATSIPWSSRSFIPRRLPRHDHQTRRVRRTGSGSFGPAQRGVGALRCVVLS